MGHWLAFGVPQLMHSRTGAQPSAPGPHKKSAGVLSCAFSETGVCVRVCDPVCVCEAVCLSVSAALQQMVQAPTAGKRRPRTSPDDEVRIVQHIEKHIYAAASTAASVPLHVPVSSALPVAVASVVEPGPGPVPRWPSHNHVSAVAPKSVSLILSLFATTDGSGSRGREERKGGKPRASRPRAKTSEIYCQNARARSGASWWCSGVNFRRKSTTYFRAYPTFASAAAARGRVPSAPTQGVPTATAGARTNRGRPRPAATHTERQDRGEGEGEGARRGRQ